MSDRITSGIFPDERQRVSRGRTAGVQADRADVVQSSTVYRIDDGLNLQRRDVAVLSILFGPQSFCAGAVSSVADLLPRLSEQLCAVARGWRNLPSLRIPTTVRSHSRVLALAARRRRQRLGSSRS